jgi:hypothetical protein
MASLPGWDSIETSTRLHDFFELGGIILFLVVVAFELLAFSYGHHIDWLVGQAASTAATQQQQAEQAAEARHASEIGGLKSQLSEADKKVAELEAKQPQRRLKQTEKDTLIAALRPFAGQKISITCIMGDIYGKELAEDFVSVMRAANWDDGGGIGINQVVYMQDPEGIILLINQGDASAQRATPGITALTQTLAQLHLIPVAGLLAILRFQPELFP